MSETKFTPGPWVAVCRTFEEARADGEFTWVWDANSLFGDSKVGSVWQQKPDGHTGLPGSIEVSEANAHLIASAPDLYAAAEAIVAACECERPDIVGRDDDYIYDELGSAMSGAYVAARAALAKARGEA